MVTPVEGKDYILHGFPYFSTPMMYTTKCQHCDYVSGKWASPGHAERAYRDHWKAKHKEVSDGQVGRNTSLGS